MTAPPPASASSNKRHAERPPLDPAALAEGLRAGNRAALARAITLVESKRADHRALAQDLLKRVLAETGQARRVGITGVPGVGKSTFIEAFGELLCAQGHRVAVLAVDPSSGRTGGSILGDKTRMGQLAVNDRAFIRPSPAAGTLGGVAAKTRETMLLCEAAGYDVILIETVGVGQSETVVSEMVDFFLVLMLPGAGDDLQGIKKGVLEIADMIAVNKAEGDNEPRARAAANHYRTALHIMTPKTTTWTPPVALCSGLKGEGLDEIWALIEEHRTKLTATGEFTRLRQDQQIKWMGTLLAERLGGLIDAEPSLREARSQLERALLKGETTPTLAVETLIEQLLQHLRSR